MKPERNSHCSFCGTRFAAGPWPRTCASCGETTWLNPTPVAVLLLPVDEGLLAIRRGIEPGRGSLALPGGYVNLGETWQEAAARELREETGIIVAAGEIADVCVRSSPVGVIVAFGRARRRAAEELPAFVPTDETTERVILAGPQELAFQLHTQVAREFFERR